MQKITINDKKYPKSLLKIDNPPKQLYLEGNIELLNKNCIAIIGSRNCSENGKKLAQKFAIELSNQGIIIISGMAKGIDSEAHKGTLRAKGKTIAVLGSGLNNIFPKENTNLYKEILENKGLIISEYKPNIEPCFSRFLERNRIVSGLSIGVLVVEAGHRSGTSVTASLAQKQGKKVFVIPHEINDKHGVGTNRLIRKGAILITKTKEIIDEFEFLKYKEIQEYETKINEKIKAKIKFENKEQECIYNILNNSGSEKIISINDICQKIPMPINKINENLLILEINQYIQKRNGGYICINNMN